MRGQASFLTTMILVAFALILGTAMAIYFISTLNSYRSQVNIVDTLVYESANIVLKPIATDTVNGYEWVLLKRLDNMRRPFFIAVEAIGSSSSTYISCNSIFVYNYSRDRDGIMCSNDGDCSPSKPATFTSGVYALGESGIIPYNIYAKIYGYSSTPPGYGYICYIDSFEPSATILSISIGISREINIHIINIIDNTPYIVKTYSIKVG
ncbi:hypothetical protein Igag_1686 [Ignisphaera aggregans DSM 17230]|uniref:Flagellin n=1 Tax=Ignisphaera aggregans (strain DSM 17230 / JCM 13409 / AQ1.S1) TaxID=583356 RepID=E0SRV2_IGNAA|nr:hypothetical protein Igag_1686 [Ignisphaera aggregans DSM 17230]